MRIWDIRTRKLAGVSLQNESSRTLAFSPDGWVLAIGLDNNTVQLWDVPARRFFAATLQLQAVVDIVAFSPNGRTIATASRDGILQLWNAEGKPIAAKFQSWGQAYALAFSPDGQILATGSPDGTARLWSTLSGEPLTASFKAASYSKVLGWGAITSPPTASPASGLH